MSHGLRDLGRGLLRTSANSITRPARDISLVVDGYVPLAFESCCDRSPAGYLRLGNYSTTLVELAVEVGTQVLRGLTVVSIDRISEWPGFGVTDVEDGLPTLS